MTKSDPRLARSLSLVQSVITIPPEIRAIEAKLLITKWPAYRFMPPREATARFQMAYEEGARAYLRRNVDIGKAAGFRAFATLRTDTNNKHYTQLWVARQQADALGMPYESFVEFAMDFAARRRRRTMPQPNQLGPNSKSEVAWSAEHAKWWPGERERLLRAMPPMSQYCVDNDQRLPAQDRYRDQLLELIATTSGPDWVLASRLDGRRELSREQVEVALAPGLVERARQTAESEIREGWLTAHVYDRLEVSQIWQSCFGLPGVDRDVSGICATCPQRESCRAMEAIVVRQVSRQAGSEEPILDARRRAGRARTAKCRANAKEATGVPVAP